MRQGHASPETQMIERLGHAHQPFDDASIYGADNLKIIVTILKSFIKPMKELHTNNGQSTKSMVAHSALIFATFQPIQSEN